MKDKFSISIKGVLYHEGRYLLRKNQRDELELLGGKLETGDISMEERLREEFLEESGIKVQINSFREPWLYVVEKKNAIIVPFVCSAVDIPDTLFDEDGGELVWVFADELEDLNMPAGYLHTIYDRVPSRSSSPFEGEYLKIIPNYVENRYEVVVRVRDTGNNLLLEKDLGNFTAPRELIAQHAGSIKLLPQPATFSQSKLYISYLHLGEESPEV